MQLFSWLRKRMTGRPPTRRTSASKPRPSFRPRLEVLEGRDVPSTLTVTNNLDSGTGSLRAEIAAAKNGDTNVFAPSLNGQTITLTSGQLVTIQGPGAGQLTVSGNNTFRIFWVGAHARNVTLTGLTISNGAARNGGGIYNAGGLTVSDCTLSSNSTFSGDGGGIYNAYRATLTVSGCTLSGNNSVGSGGGIYNAGGATASVTGCTFSSNIQYGDLSNDINNAGYADTLTISNSHFSSRGEIQGLWTDGGGNTFG
jgi:Right handed beta helix region